MKLFRGQMWSAFFSIRQPPSSRRRDGQFLVAVGEIALAVLETVEALHRPAHGGEGAVDPDDGFRAGRDGFVSLGLEELRRRSVEVGVEAAMVEFYLHVRITLGGFDHDRVESAAPDRIDVLVRVAVVGGEMQVAGFVVDHAAAHRDGVLHHFVGNPELRESVDAAGGESEINRTAANRVAGPRIGPAFVEIDLVTAPPEVTGKQTAG